MILACEMIEDEVRLALEAVPADDRPPVVWVESGLHERPERLREALQELIAQLDEGAGRRRGGHPALGAARSGDRPTSGASEVQVEPVDEVLLALGFCGSALQGLSAKHLSLVFPRVDDCVSLLLNRGCAREQIPRDPRHYYLTRGWFSHESTLKETFEEWDKRYGAGAGRQAAQDHVRGLRAGEPDRHPGLRRGRVPGREPVRWPRIWSWSTE